MHCLETFTEHLNEQVAAAVRSAELASCHAQLRPAMYHYFKTQLEGLPDISARVAKLIRLFVLYLQPWPIPRKAANADADAATPAAAGALVGVDASHWEWAGFVQRNFLLYTRLLTSVAKETVAGRFNNLQEKREYARPRRRRYRDVTEPQTLQRRYRATDVTETSTRVLAADVTPDVTPT